ncbi:alpha-amylase family glycosyl hydrolase [Planomicrobium sp. CPCC 101110]|uniref:alpha-amylase family glycosyl hydrolase n=1 Tax=Planomicrobium sp. CPCC 101110 TaxID=2599619 RepID=UPI0011B8367A|nr:alpha-amylase family glycosyl hydrolase [Planomicrobium sp. CPCC 101110]TWT27268.1 sugar phosphorylase [Planomicrobium sp. CPCC 101110]
MDRIRERLSFIYGSEESEKAYTRILASMEKTKAKALRPRKQAWDEKDVVLITYGDQFQEEGTPTLQTLKKMYDRYLADKFGIVHILPFYPYSSDDGFSVIDYRKVDPAMGGWSDIQELSESASIMFDDVCNHISARSEWFQEYLNNNPKYAGFFVEADPAADLSGVTRPRALPLLTPFRLANGEEKHFWTTFSADQIDLNFANPDVLAEMVDVLLFYIEQGAEYIRLDAIGFMWKEIGTTCIHHEKTHEIVKLFRDIVDSVAKGTVLITETNVPHKDNVSYFGNGRDEAHMVYQFPLPPLVLYSIHNGNTRALTEWAKGLPETNPDTTFYNFLASHDGIGVNPIRGIIPEKEIVGMVEALKEEGALVNYKKTGTGEDIPYEINVTYFDALNKRGDSDSLCIKRFLAAHSVLLALPGVPAVYIQSILGSVNDYEGVRKTGANRSINRQKFRFDEIGRELSTGGTRRNRVFTELTDIIKVRRAEALFHPNVPMQVEDFGDAVFAFSRTNGGNGSLLILNNLTNREAAVPLGGRFLNIITQEALEVENGFTLGPYQFLWLKPIQEEENK